MLVGHAAGIEDDAGDVDGLSKMQQFRKKVL